MLREVYREPLRFAQGDSKRSESAQHDGFGPPSARCQGHRGFLRRDLNTGLQPEGIPASNVFDPAKIQAQKRQNPWSCEVQDQGLRVAVGIGLLAVERVQALNQRLKQIPSRYREAFK